MDASNLGEKIKLSNNNQKTVLSTAEINMIIDTFNSLKVIDDFSSITSYDEIKSKKYTLNPGRYFETKIEYSEMTKEQFESEMSLINKQISGLLENNKKLDSELTDCLRNLKYDI